MALFTCAAKLDPGAHGMRCARAKAVHHAEGISHERNSGYRPSRVNIVAQGLSKKLLSRDKIGVGIGGVSEVSK